MHETRSHSDVRKFGGMKRCGGHPVVEEESAVTGRTEAPGVWTEHDGEEVPLQPGTVTS